MRKFALLLVLLSAAVCGVRAQPSGITATLQLERSQFLPDEDLQAKVRIVNRSGQPVTLGADQQWISFAVVGEHDDIARKLGEMPVEHAFTLLSGQAITLQFNPTPYFSFRRSGRYSLTASITVPKWKQAIPCKPVPFMISDGIPYPEMDNVSVGVPALAGVTNEAPEARHYTLLKVSYIDQIWMYFRLTDEGGRTLRVFPLARVVNFGGPEAQIDHGNKLHVMVQTGARDFTYFILDANGNMLLRQTHEYTETRPTLRLSDDGQIFVGGGRRLLLASDIPPPPTASAAKPQ